MAWTNALQGLIADSDQLSKLASQSRARARHFTPTAMGSRYLEVYRELLVRRSTVQPEVALA
jgi:hypothetical protein